VEVIEPTSQHVVFSQKIHADVIHALAWRPDNTRLTSSSADGTLKLITASAGQPLLTFAMAERSGSHLAWSANGRRLAAISAEGAVQIWDATRGYEIAGGGKRRGELAWAYFDRAHATTGPETRLTLREALRHAPDTMDYWDLRGRIHGLLGNFDQAAEEFAKLASPDFRRNIRRAADLARCLMAAGNDVEYKRVCSSLVSAFGDDGIESSRQFVMDVCLASPNSSVDPSKLLSMAGDQRRESDNSYVYARKFYVGAGLLRQGQYEEAARLLSECVSRTPSGTDETGSGILARAKYFLALARCRLGHITQARRLLAEANEHASRVDVFTWRLRTDLEILRSEVEDALRQ
jgi:tetratricopeptide (TPR) repeat protein